MDESQFDDTALEIIRMFRIIAPEFTSSDEVMGISDEKVAERAEFVSPLLSKKKFGKLYTRAVAYLVAHEFALAEMVASDGASSGSVTSGAIQSEKEGDLERSFANIGASSTMYDKTSYGKSFLSLRSMCIVPVTVR